MTHMDAATVLSPTPHAQVTCSLSAKIVELCDGKRTLQEVARLLDLPQLVCERLVLQAVNSNWLMVQPYLQSNSSDFWDTVQGLMTELLGEEGNTILLRASSMIGSAIGQVPRHEIRNFLIAVELNAAERSRNLLIPHLDILCREYAA
ncbi:hypothetical protein Dxin01_01259 [Deinococcus xinjiangensis]|uniref:Uncharacterized protein n=1 Tax=Deinococcus xinjiangensis TaxID=457454 RepID=A0ABP9V8E2_9DEIO